VTTRGTRIGCAALVLFASLPADAYLCTRTSDTGPSLAWPTREITMRVTEGDGSELSEADLDSAVRFSANAWNDVPCSDFVVIVGDTTRERRAGFDWAEGADSPANVHIVTWRSGDPDDLADTWLHPVSALAITTVTYVRTSGRILDADIEMNDGRFTFTTCDPAENCIVRHDLKNTLVHEMGHVVGLDHPPVNQPLVEDATMYSSAPEGETKKRTLADDDVDGICALYPVDAPTGECYGVQPVDPPDIVVRETGCGGGSLAVIGLPLVVGFRVRRRRSCSTATRDANGQSCP
jgi:hypothetical protein